ncbi:geranylgeranylglycerol-phosphate geranylgeranyltransferase [Flavobacterium undicola]|uniref:geranylgeranylglycerol-phosphate geranylgeranyltransferase n=1 Tax=Flavobacterium undicola TaxID=1932779 RepID=UPI001378A6C2|nr:geranylgeranylglycerol-phosphate geranylgeranyltransferase [Flavobacterium undicola]MBA0883097.1 geranylgeranylglycerol-phosphate geranylgeranyltransferase [Flavobacterium undicola]
MLNLIRYKNLLILALMQIIFRYGFLKLQNIDLALADWQYGLLVLSTVLIAAAGYVINDIFDQETDNENKPDKVIVGKLISENKAYTIYALLNVSGVAIGFYLSNVIMRPNFAAIFVLTAATLYIYATSLKQMLLLGNIVVALLLSLSVVIIGIFDLFPATNATNQEVMATLFSILLDYAIFAFMINLLREIVKDLEDFDGDFKQGMSTLAIVLGVQKTAKLVFVLSFVPIIALLIYINNYLVAHNLIAATIYSFVFILGPMLYFSIKIWTAQSKTDFQILSKVLKWILFFGILSILFITLNIKYHASK